MANISKQLDNLNKRENSLKQQMKQMKQQKAQLEEKKKKEYKQEKEKIIKKYIKKFDKLGMQVDLELDPMIVLISSIDNDSEYGACYSAETLTKESLDELLVKIKIAQHIEKHSEFKLVSTSDKINDGIKMELNENYTRYELTIDKIGNEYVGVITKEREEDIEGEYVRQVKPQLFVDIEPFGYDGFYVTWKHEVVGTSRTIGTSIKKALDVLRNIQ